MPQNKILPYVAGSQDFPLLRQKPCIIQSSRYIQWAWLWLACNVKPTGNVLLVFLLNMCKTHQLWIIVHEHVRNIWIFLLQNDRSFFWRWIFFVHTQLIASTIFCGEFDPIFIWFWNIRSWSKRYCCCCCCDCWERCWFWSLVLHRREMFDHVFS